MSHLTRVLLLFPLLLLCTLSSPAQTVTVTTHKTATELRDLCRAYIIGTGTLSTEAQLTQHQLNVGICLGYIQGAADALTLAMGNFQFEAKACMPSQPTTEEQVRVTLKYIDGHPELLSYSAADVVWRAMIASYPCPAK